MANEIVKMVAKKANLSEPIAQIAVDTVLNMLKSKLPSGVGGIVDSFMGSSGSVLSSKTSKASTSKTTTSKTTKTGKNTKKDDDLLGGLGNIAGTIGSLLGGKK